MKTTLTAILAILVVAAMTLFSGCKKDGSTTPADPNPSGSIVKEATLVSFNNNDASGNPTSFYATNENTGQTVIQFKESTAGTYTAKFISKTNQPIVSTPRPGTSNVVSFNVNVGDTLEISMNGTIVTKVVFINDNADIRNGGILVSRKNFETNEAAGIRLNNYVANIMPAIKFKPS